MRRYAFEALISHFAWSLFLFGSTNGFSMPFALWLEHFYQWDARWYGSIAIDGYGFLPQTFVFPPFHGWLLGRITDFVVILCGFVQAKPSLTQCFYFVALSFGVACFACANTILVWLAERRWKIQRRRMWFFALSNPMAYFAFTAYSDMFFFALMCLTVTAALMTGPRREVWNLPRLSPLQERITRGSLIFLVFLTPWVRLTGFAFSIWIFLKRKESIATLVSLAAFLGFDWYRTGNPFFFLLAQKAFMMPDGGLITGLINSIRVFGAIFDGTANLGGELLLYAVNFGVLPLVSLALSLALIAWLFKRCEFEWATMLLAIVIISHNQAFWRSTVRYALPFYPLFFWMLWARPGASERTSGLKESMRQIATALLVALGLTLQVFYARLFHVGAWAF